MLDPDALDLDLATAQAACDRALAAAGAGHLLHDLPLRADGRRVAPESRPWRLDPLPVVLGAVEFDWLAAALVERVRALEAILVDLHGPRNLLRDGVLPPSVLASSSHYRLSAVGSTPSRWLSVYAADLVCDRTGRWSIVQDLTDAPVGPGYCLLGRSVLSGVTPGALARAGAVPLDGLVRGLRASLSGLAGVESPRVVVFTGGIDHPSYVDHSQLAVALGVNLVEGTDLVVRQRRVWLRSLDGLEPVDVLYRRISDREIDPLDIGAAGSGGVPGLLQAVREHNVGLGNAHGAGVIESDRLAPYLEDALDAVASERLALSRDPEPITRPSPVPVSPHVGLGERAEVVLRIFVTVGDDGPEVVPGGVGRLLAAGDDPRYPTAGVVKDVWVASERAAGARPRVRRLPQVDLGRSVPTRAAAGLYWMNRAAERAEATARLTGVLLRHIEADARWADLDDGQVGRRVALAALALAGPSVPGGEAEVLSVPDAVTSLVGACRWGIGSVLVEATTVREYLSLATGRVLAELADGHEALTDEVTVADLDTVLFGLAAVSGQWNESTVRGPAWLLGDIGRRLERASVVFDLAGALAEVEDPEGQLLEVLLAANESLVAYRRRYRNEADRRTALALIVTDDSNPRSAHAALTAVRHHAMALGWPDVDGLLDETLGAAAAAVDGSGEWQAARRLVDTVGSELVGRWFSAPVSSVPMRASEQL